MLKNALLNMVGIIATSFKSAIGDWKSWLKTIWLPLTLLIIVGSGGVVLEEMQIFSEEILKIAQFILGLLLGSMLLINLYIKAILNHEPPSLFYLPLNKSLFKFLAYVALLLLIMSLVFSPVLGMFIYGQMVFTEPQPTYLVAMGSVTIVLLIVMLYMSLRLFFVLPNVAIQDPTPLRSSWRLTKGHVSFMFFTIMMMMIILVGAAVLLMIPFGLGVALTSPLFLMDESAGFLAASPILVLYVAVVYFIAYCSIAKLTGELYNHFRLEQNKDLQQQAQMEV